MNEEQTLYSEAVLGKTTDAWFKGELGQYVLGVSQQEIIKKINEFRKTSPFRVLKIWKIQREIEVAQGAIKWLEQVIINGRTAETILNQRHDEGER